MKASCGAAPLRRRGDRVARPQRADQHHVVPVLGGERGVVREGRGDTQVDPAPCGLALQEVGLHVDVAVAEQDGVDTSFRGREVGHRGRRPGGPVVEPALLGFAAVALQQFERIAAVAGAHQLAETRRLVLRALLGERAPLQERADAVGERIAVAAQLGHQRQRLVRQRPRLGEEVEDPRDLVVGEDAQVADRVHQQHPVRPHRYLVHETGRAQAHRSLANSGPKSTRPASPQLVTALWP